MKWKRYATPLILSSVILGLAAVAYWDDKQTASDKSAEELKGRLFDFDPAQVVSVEVSNATAEPRSWELVKDPEGKTWSVAAPLNYRADGEGIDRLLKIIVEAKSEREFELEARSLEDFGLSPPQLLYVLKDASGKSWRFAIGGKSPTGYASYASVGEGGEVHLVNQYLFTAMNKTLTDFRDRSLGFPPVAEVNRIEVSYSGDSPILLEKHDKTWKLVQPIQAEGDSLEINKWLSGWDMLRAADFIDSPEPSLRKALTVLGKGTSELVRLKLQAGSGPKEYLLVENNGKVYTQLGESTFVELDKASVEALRKSPQDLEDRSIFGFASTDVTKVNLDGVDYIKEKGEWVSAGDKKPMPFVQGMVVSLEFAKAERKLSAKEAAASMKGPARHTVEITSGDQPPVQFSVWESPAADNSAEPPIVLKLGESHYEVNHEFIDLLKPKAPTTEPTLGGGIKGEKS